MKITGGNVGGMNAKISPSGAIAVGRKYFPSNRVRAVQVVDRERKINFLDVAGNYAIGGLLAGTAGEIVGGLVTRPRETITVAISLWWDKAIIGIVTHEELRSLASAVAVNAGREPDRPPVELIEQRGRENASDLLSNLESGYDAPLHLRKAHGPGRGTMVVIVVAALALLSIGVACVVGILQWMPVGGQ